MHKTLKKLGAILLALTMLFALNATAFAAQTETVDYAKDVDPEVTITSNQITIHKDIVVYNTDEEQIFEPNVTYKYTLSNQNPGTPPALITDDPAIITYDNDATKAVTAAVKQGVTGGVKLSSDYTTTASTDSALLKFGQESTETTAATATNLESVLPIDSSTGTETSGLKKITRNLTVTIDPTAFKIDNVLTPGVYRYKITETAAEASYPLSESGVTRTSAYAANHYDVLYLDVYLKWTDDNKTALEAYGAVLFHSTDGQNGFKYTAGADAAIKVTGFDVASQGNDVDTYHTWNLTVAKTVSGELGDKNHLFPFSVDFSESAAKTAQFYAVASTGNYGSNTALALTGGALKVNDGLVTSTMALKDSGTVVFKGLPTDVKVIVKEKNDTVDYYTASAKNNKHTGTDAYTLKNNDGTPVVAANVAMAATTGTAEFSAKAQMIEATTANATGNKYQSNTMTFNNNLDAVSPTGVVLRVAPYALMLAAGFLFLAISKRRKEENEA